MEQITLIYLENNDADYRKSCKHEIKPQYAGNPMNHWFCDMEENERERISISTSPEFETYKIQKYKQTKKYSERKSPDTDH